MGAGSSQGGAKLDDVDVKILRLLQRDARTPFTDIAKTCGVSTDTIIRRFNGMVETGVVSGTTVLLNPKKFGCEHVVSFSINVNYPHINGVLKFIREIPEVFVCVPSIGRYNLFSIAAFGDIAHLAEVRDLIRSYPHVESVSTNIWTGKVLVCPENFEFEH